MIDDSSEISRMERTNSLGMAYAKTIILLNGGGILALLTFVGNADAQTAITISLTVIKYSMAMFTIGIFAIMLAMLVSYSYSAAVPESTYSQFWSRWIVSLNSIMGIFALAGFIAGIAVVLCGGTAA